MNKRLNEGTDCRQEQMERALVPKRGGVGVVSERATSSQKHGLLDKPYTAVQHSDPGRESSASSCLKLRTIAGDLQQPISTKFALLNRHSNSPASLVPAMVYEQASPFGRFPVELITAFVTLVSYASALGNACGVLSGSELDTENLLSFDSTAHHDHSICDAILLESFTLSLPVRLGESNSIGVANIRRLFIIKAKYINHLTVRLRCMKTVDVRLVFHRPTQTDVSTLFWLNRQIPMIHSLESLKYGPRPVSHAFLADHDSQNNLLD